MNEANRLRAARTSVAIAIAILAVSFPAVAYVGPGAGLSALGSLFALLAAVVVAIFGFLWYPIKRLFGKRRTTTAQSDSAPSPGPSTPGTDARHDDEAR
jgi:predicted membrane metal-binding protein